MSRNQLNISTHKGAAINQTITFSESVYPDGAMSMVIKPSPSETALATFGASNVYMSGGVNLVIDLNSTDTTGIEAGKHVYEITHTDDNTNVSVVAKGNFEVKELL